MDADYAIMTEILTSPKYWNRLNAKNKLAIEKLMEQLADWQERKQNGKILTHVNTDGVAHRFDPTPAIVIRQQ